MQVAFLLYVGLMVISYGLNKFSRTAQLLSQLAMLSHNTTVSWKQYVEPKIGSMIAAYKKTLESGKVRFLSSDKQPRVPSPHEVSQRKGSDFFVLWCRHLMMRKISGIIRNCIEASREHPERSLFALKVLTSKDKAELKDPSSVWYYSKKCFSLFQYPHVDHEA